MAYEGTKASEFLGTALVSDHIGFATEVVGAMVAKQFNRSMFGMLGHMASLRFDSPLEVVFWVWWQAFMSTMGNSLLLDFALQSQCEVSIDGKDYRLDFEVCPTKPAIAGSALWTPIAVEVDGHGFHERTPEQVIQRDRRDRALQSAGWKVFHFSFTELTTDAMACVGAVLQLARTQESAIIQREGLAS